MLYLILRALGAGLVLAVVAEVPRFFPRLGAMLLTLPIVIPIVFLLMYVRDQDLAPISRLSRDTLLLIPLGLPFFVPLAFAHRLNLTFWPAFFTGLLLVATTITLYLWLAPSNGG